VIKWLGVFSGYTGFLQQQKNDCHDITEMLLKVALNSITLTQQGPLLTYVCMLIFLQDGKFYYLEHVAAERGTVLNRVQKLMNPAWHCCTGDCEITRETGRAIASAGFSKTWMEHFNLNTIIFMIKPFLLGTATK
jgi:hypothetical protein